MNASGKIEENTAKLSVNIFLTFKWKGYGHEFNVPNGRKDETEALFRFSVSILVRSMSLNDFIKERR